MKVKVKVKSGRDERVVGVVESCRSDYKLNSFILT